jgi:hypothetical protein
VEVDEGFRGVRHRFGWVWRTPGIVYLAPAINPVKANLSLSASKPR